MKRQQLGGMLAASYCSLLSLCATEELLLGGVSLQFLLRILPILLCLLPGPLLKRLPENAKTGITIALSAGTAVLLGLLTGIFRDFRFAKIILLFAEAFVSHMLLRAGEDRTFPAWWPPCALLLTVLAVVQCFLRMEITSRCTVLGCGGLLSGLLWLFRMNHGNQQLGAHNAETQEALPVPKELSRSNRNLLCLFLLVGILLGLGTAGLFPYVIRGAAAMVSGLLDGAVYLGRGFEKLVAEKPGTSGANPIRAEPSPSPSPVPTMEPMTPHEKTPLENLLAGAFPQNGTGKALLAAALLLVCAAAVWLMRRRHRTAEKRGTSGYSDQIEHIRQERRFPAIRKMKQHHRKQRFSDMETDRMKLRFLWWMRLKKPPKGWSPALTPSETAQLLPPEWERVSALYALARYAPDTPLPTDAGRVAAELAGKSGGDHPRGKKE